MNNTKRYLKQIGIEDVSPDYTSHKRFGDGGQFRFEVPGIQSPKTMNALLDEADKDDIFIHRVSDAHARRERPSGPGPLGACLTRALL